MNLSRDHKGGNDYDSTTILTGQAGRRTREGERIDPKNSQMPWVRVGDMGRE